MPRSENTFSVQTNLPADMRERLAALAQHRGQSLSAAIADATRDAILAYEGGETKDAKLQRIEARLAHLENKFDLMLLFLWRMSGSEAIRMTADDVREFRALVAEVLA